MFIANNIGALKFTFIIGNIIENSFIYSRFMQMAHHVDIIKVLKASRLGHY